jgi:Ca2+-binding EF-hand superfamily protein
MARQNFDFYCKSKGGATVELFELPMILTACGYRVTPAQLSQLADFLTTRKSVKIDFTGLLAVLT